MANNTNTPNNNQEWELDRFINDKNAKMNTFRNFFYNYCDTPAWSAFLRSNGDKAYGGAMNTNTLFGAYFDSLKKTHPYTNPTNGAWLTDQSKTDVQDNIATTNKDEFQSLIYSQYNLLLRQESHLLTKITSWYDVGTPNLSQAAVNTEIKKLSLKDINTALYSSSRLTNLVNAWHKASTTHDYNFQGHKKKMIEDIAAITGIATNDANLVDIYNRITRDENASIANLEKILGNIDGLTPDQKFNILAIIKPTISLREYRTIAAKHNGGALKNDDEIVEDIINAHTAAPALTPDQKDRTKRRILDTIDRNGDNIHVPLSWIKDRRATDYLNLFQDVAEEAIGTMADKKKREETLEKFDQREIGAKHTERDKDIKVNLDDELESLKAQGEHNFAQLKDAGINADSHDQILGAFIARLRELNINQPEKIKTLTTSTSSSLYIIYRMWGVNQYVEMTAYNGNATPIPTIRCINHTNVDGEYYENTDSTDVPIDKIVATLLRADRWEGWKDSFFTKGENGRVVEKSFVEDLVNTGKLKENIKDGEMKREDLEKKLFELDGEKNKLEPGLLIQTMDTQGKPMFVEVTAIDENAKTISINTTIDSTDATNIVHLQFHEFLGVFNRTQCKRVWLAKDVKTFIELCQKTKKPSEFAHISLKEGKLQYKNDKVRADYIVGGFRTRGNKPNHIRIDTISDARVTFYYIEEGELETEEKDGKTVVTNRIKTKPKPKSVRKYNNVSLKFLADQLNFLHDGDWQTFQDDLGEDEKKRLEDEEKKQEQERNHKHEHKPHYHGWPLQWMAHSKNFGHLFKGMGMAFGELKHFIEHGDEHVAKEMEYAFISWMRDTPWLQKFMPEEIYLDMKAEIESKKKEAIDKLRDKWGWLSTWDCGKMAAALLADKHTTIEQMFGIIFGIHKKVGTLYGIPNLQSERASIHVDGIEDPVPIFLYKLCVIQWDDPKKMINELRRRCSKWWDRAIEGNINPVPEMYLIQVYSHLFLQTKNPPPVPGSFHAKIAAAWVQGEQDQKKWANEGEANMYATQDQIETRMYALAGDGEVAQAVGFYEKLIPRWAPMSTLMGLPFVIATTGLRDNMSNQLIRELHINGVYEQGFSSSMLTALESQDKYTNFRTLLDALADNPYEINGEAILPASARKDLKKLLHEELHDIPEVGRKWSPGHKPGKQVLSQRVQLAQKFWASYGKRLMHVLDGNDDQLLLLQQQKDIKWAEDHFKNTKERTEWRSFNANLTSWKNGHYNTDSANYTLLNPKEAAASFQWVNTLTGKFKSDDNSQMHESIFMSFQQAFQRIKKIKDPKEQKQMFFEMHYEIVRKIMGELSDDIIEKLIKTNNHPNWYSMLRRTIGFNIKNYNSNDVNSYSGFEDPTYQAKAQKELDFLLQGGGVNSVVGNVSGHAWATINPAFQ